MMEDSKSISVEWVNNQMNETVNRPGTKNHKLLIIRSV